MSFASIRITTRLALGFGLVLALIAAIVALAALTQREVGALSDQLTNVDYPKTRLVNRMLAANLENAKSVMELVVATEPAEVTAIQAAIEANRKSNATTMEELDKLLARPEAKTLYEALKQARARYIASRNKVMDLVVKDKNRDQAVALWTSDARLKLDVYSTSIRSLLEFQETLIHEDNRAIEQALSRNRQLNLVGGALALLFGVSFAWWIARSITRPLRAAVDLAEAVAAGDLTRRIETAGRDEVGHLLAALARMNDRLAGVIGRIREATDAVGTASREIAAGNADLSQRPEEQASSLEETASSMEELTSTVRQNADNARQANQLATSASAVASKGGVVVGEVVGTMHSIADSSRKIADIISVIDGIAFQTNILALNAAVEAARAGEQGRGFAVVASEVRSLAQRSAAAAKEIKELITDSATKVDSGSKLVEDAGQTMAEVVASVKRVTDIMAEITAASMEQSTGIAQVNEAIVQMDQVTQQNAALVEESAAAAESMEEQARQLAQAVSVFKLAGSAAADPAQVAIERAQAAARAKPAPATQRVGAVAPAPKAAPKPALAPKLAAKAKAEADDEWAEF
jgi:methyl-accepting chemotaxis protein